MQNGNLIMTQLETLKPGEKFCLPNKTGIVFTKIEADPDRKYKNIFPCQAVAAGAVKPRQFKRHTDVFKIS